MKKKKEHARNDNFYFKIPKKTITAGIIMSVALGVVAAGIIQMKRNSAKEDKNGK